MSDINYEILPADVPKDETSINLRSYFSRLSDERLRRSAIAAHLGACLELVRDGVIELSQAAPFGPIYVRRKR